MAKYKVLSTKKLRPSLIEQAKQNDIEIIQDDFISIKPRLNKQTLDAIPEFKGKKSYVALTSANAVEILIKSMAEYDDCFTDWKIFCLSGKTKQTAQASKLFNENIVDEANNAKDLAKKIIEKGVSEIVFFCGDKRRDELPKELRNAKIKVHEVVLYETLETPAKVDDDLNAILFFSPSAVKSFFSRNKLQHDAICFAIGGTTATSIAAFAKNEVIICSTPNPESMIEKVIHYFKQKSAVY